MKSPARFGLAAALVATMVAGCAGVASPTVAPTQLAAATPSPTLEPTAAAAPTATPAPATPAPICASPCSVTMLNFAYAPSTLNIKVGTEVIWTNALCRGGCTVTFIPGIGVDSGPIAIGATFKYTFGAAGVYPFHCRLDPLEMVGTITVT